MSSLTFILLSLVGIFLVVAVVMQWLKIQELLHEKSLALPQKVTGKHVDLIFLQSPFPLCVVDQKNTILWATSMFWKLADSRKIRNLADFDTSFGSSLNNLPHEGVSAHHFKLSIRSQDPEDSLKRRLFTIVSWPYNQERSVGRVLCFFEQTSHYHHSHLAASFEHQLVRYVDELSKNLIDITADKQQVPLEQVRKQAEEAQTVALYLQEIHHQLRKQSAHEPINLTEICKDIFAQERKVFQQQKLHLITTLPHRCLVYGTPEEIRQSIELVIEGVKELAGVGQDLRVDVHSEKREVRLSFQLPGVIVPESWVHHLTNFGRKQGPLHRLSRLKLALAQQIASKYNGGLKVSSNEHEGTTVDVFFVNADTREKLGK